MMKKHCAVVLIAFCVMVAGVAAGSVAAQTGELDPLRGGALLDLLALVPDTEEARLFLAYGDLVATDLSNPAAARPETTEAFIDMGVSQESRRIMLNLPLYALPNPQYLVATIPDVPAVMGIDLMQLERSINWGMPPAYMYLLQGGFDPAAVAAAHEARDYEHSELNVAQGEFSLWCGAVGCDQGTRMDINNRLNANLFGGELGRQFPFVMSSDRLIIGASPSLDLVQDTLGLMLNDASDINGTLANVPGYRSVVLAIHDFAVEHDMVLRQLVFLQSDLSIFVEPDPAGLPRFSPLVFAEVGSENGWAALVVLPYADAANAETAAGMVNDLINTTASTRAEGRTIGDILEQRGGSVNRAIVSETDAGSVVIVPITYDIPEEIGDNVFVTLFNLYNSADMNWLRMTE